ncbi:hypothetical protein MBANPS3_000068 [Mucor bainieri]
MKEVLEYSQYNYLICFDADENDTTFIAGSSNRAISSDTYLLNVNDFIETTESPPFKQHSTFRECFDLLSKERDQLLDNEKARLASIRELFKRIKETLLEKHGIALESTQLLFVMPLGWTEGQYKDKLRAFFLDVGWITPKDNKSKIIMIPLIQVLAEHFQEWNGKTLDRERASVLFSMQQLHGENTTEFRYTFFKMQSAKELITVSKTLASSDFLLVPSIVSTESIDLASFQDVIYNAVKQLVASIQGKDPKCTSDENSAEKKDPASMMAYSISYIQEYTLKFGHWTLQDYFRRLDFEKHQLQDLGRWTCDQLITAVYEDVNVKHYFEQVSSFLKEALDGYGAAKDAPDGIQHVLLYSRHHSDVFSRRDPSSCIQHALLEENLIQPGNTFLTLSSDHLNDVAMQQPYKMIQIANAILPPVIVGDEAQNGRTVQTTCRPPVKTLITPNSFYVQASVTETQISFILNKVINAPPFETGIDLFTVQERSIEMENVADTATYLLWNHYQTMNDIEEQQHGLFERCQDHGTMVLLSSQYKEFNKNARKLIDSWLATEDTFAEGGLDTYQLVSVDQQCTCALKLSQRLLLEVGLKPAIANIATTITSALFSDDFFGLYPLSALIIEKNWKTIKNLPFLSATNGLLKQALREFLQIYHNRLLLLIQEDKCANSNISQYLGRGAYSQVLGATYTFKLKLVPNKGTEPILGLLEGNNTCKKLPPMPEFLGQGGSKHLFEFKYSGLVKEEDLPLNGIALTFLTKGCKRLRIDVYVSDDSKGGTSRHQVGAMVLLADSGAQSGSSPVSVKILPVHYSSSTLKFVATSLTGFLSLELEERSFNVLERPFLKKKV